MSRGDTAGRGPRAARRVPSRSQRSSAPLPKRLSPREESKPAQRTTYTARAAVLALAVASVIVAVALPFKIWLGQRGDIGSLSAQIKAEQDRVAHLQALHQRWSDPSFVEQQAGKRLHYVMPGHKTYVVLGKGSHAKGSSPKGSTPPANAPWYSQLWQSMQTAGGVSVSK
jgi:hypothetical protein